MNHSFADSMDLEVLLRDSQNRQHEFPITATKVFLAHAATSPLPRRISNAMVEYANRASSEGQWEFAYHEIEADTRNLAAKLLSAERDEIALVSSTSTGLNIIASGLSWEKGDNIIIADGDFPANIYPWVNLQRLGVQVKFIPKREDGSVTVEDVASLVDGRTRLVSLSSVNYLSGFKIDVSKIGSFLHRRGILFCVDAIQSIGALSIDLEFIDFLAAGANKWILGPLGTGLLYIKRRSQPKLHPGWVGWKGIHPCGDYTNYNISLPDSAKKMEPTPLCITGLFGFHSALRMLLDIQIPKIESRLMEVQNRLGSLISEKGYKVVSKFDSDSASGITSFTTTLPELLIVRKQLDDAGFVVSIRDGLTGGKFIRVAPHFYNTDDEIAAFLDALPVVHPR